MNFLQKTVIALGGLVLVGAAYAADADADSSPVMKVFMYEMGSKGHKHFVGTVNIQEGPNGLIFTPQLYDLKPGPHGFHLHQNHSCDDNGMAAGGHFDPENTGKHLGPEGNGHLGDLPVLVVAKNGTATTPVVAPRLHHLDQIDGLALMIHEGGDNYSDTPNPLGGGGGRMVCGVIPE